MNDVFSIFDDQNRVRMMHEEFQETWFGDILEKKNGSVDSVSNEDVDDDHTWTRSGGMYIKGLSLSSLMR